jgi:Tfp pilus assembly protein PilN
MIEINLRPGNGKKSRSRGAPLAGFDAAGTLGALAGRVKDPFLIGAIVAVLAAAGAVGWLHTTQAAEAAQLADREAQALRDSTRFHAVIAERRKALAERDSVLRTLHVIRSIDDARFVWAHVLDEVSLALPAYTWLTELKQTSTPPVPAAAPDSAAAADSGAAGVPSEHPPEPRRDPPLKFRVVGHTVDIQALTLFMKQLEASPFIQRVQLARSEMVMEDQREVTRFQLEAEFEAPATGAVRTIPVTLSER